jgi:probable selenium-dependent hydroxylase accessory protein YqeC
MLIAPSINAFTSELLTLWGLSRSDDETVAATRKDRCIVVCVVGAGGKSTTTFAVARALAETGRRIIVTTTTKMGHDQTGGFEACEPIQQSIGEAFEARQRDGELPIVRVVKPQVPGSPKVLGPAPEWLDEFALSGDVDAIVIEADGARRQNAKAPGPMEPVFPTLCTHIICVLGADALDRVIEDQGHRPMRIAAAAGCGPYDRLTAARAAKLLTSDIGGRKGHIPNREWIGVVTQIKPDSRSNAEQVITAIRASGFQSLGVSFDDTAKSLVRPQLKS